MARPQKKKQYLMEKYYELVWALAKQDYNNADIGVIFNRHRSNIKKAVAKMPKEWQSKWTKVHG